jgi:hypothetical protein
MASDTKVNKNVEKPSKVGEDEYEKDDFEDVTD